MARPITQPADSARMAGVEMYDVRSTANSLEPIAIARITGAAIAFCKVYYVNFGPDGMAGSAAETLRDAECAVWHCSWHCS